MIRSQRESYPGIVVKASWENDRTFSAFIPRQLPASGEQLAILDEAAAGRDLVVKRLGRRVGLMRQPIDPARAMGFRLCVHGFDQGPRHTPPPRLLGGEQILQIAIIGRGPGGTMIDVMNDTDDPTIENGRKS